MPSMSYCRFENTLGDLAACVGDMQEARTLKHLTRQMSSYEERAFYAMWNVCREFLAEHERLLNTKEDTEEYLDDEEEYFDEWDGATERSPVEVK